MQIIIIVLVILAILLLILYLNKLNKLRVVKEDLHLAINDNHTLTALNKQVNAKLAVAKVDVKKHTTLSIINLLKKKLKNKEFKPYQISGAKAVIAILSALN